MAQTTTYTCDRCDYTSTTNTDWVSSKPSYYTKDYCPACVKQLVAVGLQTEESNKTAKASKQTQEIPF